MEHGWHAKRTLRERVRRWHRRNREELGEIRRLVLYPGAALSVVAAFALVVCCPAAEPTAPKESLSGGDAPAAPIESPEAEPPPNLPQELAERVHAAVVSINITNGRGERVARGSGFFIDPGGTLVTCAHVAEEDKARMTVRLRGGEKLPVAAVVARRRARDLAVLKVEGDKFPHVDLAGPLDEASPGTYAFTVNPETPWPSLKPGRIRGLRKLLQRVSACGILPEPVFRLRAEAADRVILYWESGPYLEVGAPAFPGWSGSPVLDCDGRVIGVASRASWCGEYYTTYAVPVSCLRSLLREVGDLTGGVSPPGG